MGKKRLTAVSDTPVTKNKKQKQVESQPQAETTAEVKDAKAAKSHRQRVRSAHYRAALTKIDRSKTYPLVEAIKLLRQVSLTKFDASVEAHLNLTESALKANVDFPHSTGRVIRIAIADDKLLTQVEAGKIDFDILISSPAMMPKIAKLAKILGPKGLMPNPKTGTVTTDPDKKRKELEAGKILVAGEAKAPLMHVVLGKLSMSDSHLAANISALITAVTPKRITKLTLASTMSPGIKVSLEDFIQKG